MARVALSAATWKNALVVRLSTIGSPATEPSRLSSRRTRTMRARAAAAPAGGGPRALAPVRPRRPRRAGGGAGRGARAELRAARRVALLLALVEEREPVL